MVADSIDPGSFKGWEEAFQHPIPGVRKFEQRLRSHAEENGQKLRTIVGASYRDLLGTADRIIEMDGQMIVIQKGLGLAGQRCSSRAVEKVFGNVGRFDGDSLAKSE
jgi:hypothetical protein